MNRRHFLATFFAASAAAVVPALASPAAPVLDPMEIGRLEGFRFIETPMDRVQYGELMECGYNKSAEMPAEARVELLNRMAAKLKTLKVEAVEWEWLWFPAGVPRRSDPLGQHSYAGLKFFVLEPRAEHDKRVRAEIAEGGWALSEKNSPKGMKVREYADFTLDGNVARYARHIPKG